MAKFTGRVLQSTHTEVTCHANQLVFCHMKDRNVSIPCLSAILFLYLLQDGREEDHHCAALFKHHPCLNVRQELPFTLRAMPLPDRAFSGPRQIGTEEKNTLQPVNFG